MLQIIVIFIVFDYILGVFVVTGGLEAKVGFKAIAKKIMILVLVVITYSIDTIIGYDTFIKDTVVLLTWKTYSDI